MSVVDEVMMTFFPHPVQDIHDILKRGFDFDADASEYQPSASCGIIYDGSINYYGGAHNQNNGGYDKNDMAQEDDSIIFSRFDDLVSSVLFEEDQPESLTQDEEEEELVIDLQADIDWTVPPRPDTLLFRKGWGLDGLSPFVCLPPTSEGPPVYLAIDAPC